MPFLGRALYNLFFLEGKKEYAGFASFSDQELFSRLINCGFSFDQESFGYLAKEAESPEELFDMLTVDKEKSEEIYLSLFELWKRLIPDKKSISIFCDELDHLIHDYDVDSYDSEEKLQEKIFLLQDILDGGVDAKQNPHEIFALVSDYLAHDLESFIYDYIYEQIEADRDTLASELLDGFYPYVQEVLWFDYLRLRLFFKNPSEEISTFFGHFVESLIAHPDVDLFLEVLNLLLQKDCEQLFLSFFRFVVSRIETYTQVVEMLELASRFYKLVGKEKESKNFHKAVHAFEKIDVTDPIERSNPWYQKLLQV
jgi:hypothetical protein